MRSSRRSSASSFSQLRSNSIRLHGRITPEDIRSACLRRWDGRARVTTDWVNLYQEPELCFPDGDLLIYLREPGQSSRGPSFRVHKTYLKERGFDFLLDRCIDRPVIHPGTKCLLSSCHGCDIHPSPSELYIPAPSDADLDEIFDHHITTRNFFAWLYDQPLAGRALGRSLVTLKERIDYYRPSGTIDSSLEIVSFAEAQRYLDFRECIDHALAALLLAECLQIEDLWIDAFAHCVGMSHRGLHTSLEYCAISHETRLLINQAYIDVEAQLEAVRKSVRDFFEYDLSSHFLGLSQAARDHFDRFRSWLHSYHIEQHGFWPPHGLGEQPVEHEIYASMYFDFRNLYHHLVDPESSTGIGDLHSSASGGICVLQYIQAFDTRHRYESLSKTMPLLPSELELDIKRPSLQRRKSWNPATWRKTDKDKTKALRVQALITASNRDWLIMECPLVRRYSEFESQTVIDGFETISVVEGRKIRWILVYAILQTLISVMQTPRQVRNAEGLTYLLCCRPPAVMPWQSETAPKSMLTLKKGQSTIEPDIQYVHSNLSINESISSKSSLSSKQLKDRRRQSLPARVMSINTRPSTSRSVSIKRFMGRDSVKHDVPPVPKSPGFCEILVHGYGNGLNEIAAITSNVDNNNLDRLGGEETPKARASAATVTTIQRSNSSTVPSLALSDKIPDLTPTSSASVSRESSIASSNSTWSKGSPVNHSSTDLTSFQATQLKPQISLPDISKLTVSGSILRDLPDRAPSAGLNHIIDEEGLLRTVHFNTETWDDFLQVTN